MLVSQIFLLLIAPLLAFSQIVITSGTCTNGVATLNIRSYSDAPVAFSIGVFDRYGYFTMLIRSVSTGSGVLSVTLPSSLRAGRYSLEITSLDVSKFFASIPCDVSASESSASRIIASYTLSITGTPITDTFTPSSTSSTISRYSVDDVATSNPTTVSITNALPTASAAVVTASTTVAVSFGFKTSPSALVLRFLATVVTGALMI